MSKSKSLENLKKGKKINADIAREYQKKSAESRKKNNADRKELAEELKILLAAGNNQEKLSVALFEKALEGDVRAFEVIRDTIGEKPVNKNEFAGISNIVVTRELVDGNSQV